MSPGATVAVQASAVEVVEEVVPVASAVAVPAVPGKAAAVAEGAVPLKGDQLPGAAVATPPEVEVSPGPVKLKVSVGVCPVGPRELAQLLAVPHNVQQESPLLDAVVKLT